MNTGHPERATLVFPATHQAGRNYVEAARDRSETVVAASSVADADFSRDHGELLLLPYVHEPIFPACFLELLKNRNITRIHAPVAVVYSWLERFISDHNIEVELIGASPVRQEMARFDKLAEKVGRYRNFVEVCAGPGEGRSDLDMAAMFRLADGVYGESNDDKIAAMMAVFASAPKGDVIEIGSLAGKSAAVLAFLSRRYLTGPVLAIDPWQAEAAMQHDSSRTVCLDVVHEWDYEKLHQNFVVNLMPVGLGNFNYMRQASELAFEQFCRDRVVRTPEFGRLDYSGQIAVIHIDGNHDHAMVKRDCDLWLQLMRPDGWLILDDYLWAHGDGPYRVGNDLLARRGQNVERAFVCGKALFVKFANFKQ